MSRCLEVSGLRVRFGEVEVVRGVDLAVEEGEVVALLGRNGAGKTTTLRAVAGTVQPAAGRIELWGQPVLALPAHRRAGMGLALVPEGRHVFRSLTVQENLLVGRENVRRDGARQHLEDAYTLFPRLRERRRQLGWSLSGGEQQMLAIARALMGSPRLLLLDEPSLGLAPQVVRDVFRTIAGLRGQGISILLVEQNAAVALGVADRAYVIAGGRIVFHDRAEVLRERSRLSGLYFG